MEESKKYLRKDRIYEHLDNLNRQLEDLERLPVSNHKFFLGRENFERTKAIKFSLACAIQDITRIALHIAVALRLTQIKESEAESILALGQAGIIPREFADKIKGMPSFRNRLIHDYLLNKFDAEKLYNNVQQLDDFRKFSQYIIKWLERQ